MMSGMTRKIGGVIVAAGLVLGMTACGGSKTTLQLHLGFDEGQGTQVMDQAGNRQAELAYVLSKSPFSPAQDPQWRSQGIEGGCLLFDGCSNYVSYEPTDLLIQGETFSISVWVAPRTYEWDDPNAANAGNEHLTAIVDQYNKDKKQGFILGYQRFGRPCFELAVGDEWVTVWGDQNLEKDKWNHVAVEFNGKEGTVTLYINGQVSGQATVPAGSTLTPADKEKLMVGKNSHADGLAAGTYNMFSGYMDELKIFDGKLPEAELAAKETPTIEYAEIGLQNVLTEDIYKTQFHGGPYQHWMNEPHAPVYYNGKYHLFFQQNMSGTYWRSICWGHLVSDDLVSWYPVKEAITPTENTVVPDGVWSGGATLDKNGVPLLFFTAGNDSFAKDRMISNQNVGVAYPADLSDPELTEWVIYDKLAIEQQAGQGRPGEFRDSHIWKENDKWHMVVCGGDTIGKGGTALLYETDTLEVLEDGTIDMDWKFRGQIYEMENQLITYGTSWELPIVMPFANEDGSLTRYAMFISPAPTSIADNKVYYFMGDFDDEQGRFIPDPDFKDTPHLLDYGSNVFTGPSMFVDPVSGDVCCLSIMQDQRTGAEQGASDWAHCVGLTRKIWLNDDGSDLKMAPIENLDNLEESPLVEIADASIDTANDALKAVDEDLLAIHLTADVSQAESFSITVKTNGAKDETVFNWKAEGTISANTRNRGKEAKTGFVSGALDVEDGVLDMTMYIDRSLIEAYFNDTKSISVRSYADPASTGIVLGAEGQVEIQSLKVAPMKSIYQ